MSKEEIVQQIDGLYHWKEREYNMQRVEKDAKITAEVDSIVNKLKKLSPTDNSAKEKAFLLFLQGKALNAPPAYNVEAENVLSKAIKFDPALTVAWNCLGECYWKKNDPVSAKNCFLGAMSHSNVPDKDSLRSLSMVLRQLGGEPAEKRANIEESVNKAKEAVALDVKDGSSWYVLGNAYLAQFFQGDAEREGRGQALQKALKAYQQAEQHGDDSNPDLHYNRAFLETYIEEYGAAVVDFEKAAELDQLSLSGAKDMAKRIVEHVRQVSFALEKKKTIKKQLATLKEAAQALTRSMEKGATRIPASLNQLSVGSNPGMVICLKVGSVLTPPAAAVACLIVVDAEGNVGAVSLYYISPSSVHVGDSLTISNPTIHNVAFIGKNGSNLTYRTIVAEYPSVDLNGKPFDKELLAAPALQLTTDTEVNSRT